VRRGALAILATLVVAGCATPPRSPGTAVRPDPQALAYWSASGRLALSAGGEGGSGAFVWEQRDQTSQLDLRGPFGAGAVRVLATPDSLVVADGAGRSVDADAARAELQARLGAELPWVSLRYWMLGVPAPDQPAEVTDAAAAPWRVIEQAGWRIGYDAFTTATGLSLPQRFTATRGDVRVRVIVDTWSVPTGPPDAAPRSDPGP
jgi:outer membrane lipoprotein LolB